MSDPAFTFNAVFDLAITVKTVLDGEIPSLVVPKSFVGSKDRSEIESFPCIFIATCAGSTRPSGSSVSDPKPNCR